MNNLSEFVPHLLPGGEWAVAGSKQNGKWGACKLEEEECPVGLGRECQTGGMNDWDRNKDSLAALSRC